jgi:NADPH2:quinone reductase
MKAIVVHEFGDPSVLRLEDAPEPQPGPRQVVVRMHAVGVNPVEVYVRSGNYGERPRPYTPGTDGAGVIDAVGAEVRGLQAGQRVYVAGTVNGAYAEKALCEEHQVHPLPSGVTFEQGAALGVPYATAWRALFIRAQARPGETLLIHGASGGVGTAATQIARAAGLRVAGTGATEAGRQLVTENGAHVAFDHRAAGYVEEALRWTDGAGFDVIIEMLANVNLDRDLDMLARNGRVVVVGNRGSIEINPRKAMSRDAAVLGMTLFNATPKELRSIHAALVAGLEAGTLKPRIHKSFPLSEAAKAHEAVMEPGALGKIVLLPGR